MEHEDPLVQAFMQKLAAVPVTEVPRVATPDVLWLKAELLRRWAAERRVAAPLDVMEPVQIAAGLALAAGVIVWAMPSIVKALAFIHI